MQNNHRVTIAAILAVLLIGGSVWYTQIRTPDAQPAQKSKQSLEQSIETARAVTPSDYVRGNPSAPITYVVYSDFACPYCKDFHSTMKLIMEKYGKDGKVAWVFRQLPLVQLHPRAPVYALASECVGHLGGNSAFWAFADSLFDAMQPEQEVSSADLVALAQRAGVGADAFTSCMQDESMAERIQQDFDEAMGLGANGTPFTLVIAPTDRVVWQGVRPYLQLANATEVMLRLTQNAGIESPEGYGSPSAQFTRELGSEPAAAPTSTPVAATSSTSTLSSPTGL